MTTDLKGFTVVVTGGSSGMGLEMARALLSHGATVVIGARGGQKLDDAYTQLAENGHDVHAVPLDVRDEASVNAAAAWFEERFAHLDMLVNNAGLGLNAPGMESTTPGRQFYDIPVSTFNAIVETNFTGYFLVARAFAPMMVRKGKGRIVYVSTSTDTITRKGMFPYGPSKAAAEAMSSIVSEELRGLGISVNVICPGGPTDTGMTPATARETLRQHNVPMLDADVMNRAILFLASPDAEGVTGEKIVGKDFDDWLAGRKGSTQN